MFFRARLQETLSTPAEICRRLNLIPVNRVTTSVHRVERMSVKEGFVGFVSAAFVRRLETGFSFYLTFHALDSL